MQARELLSQISNEYSKVFPYAWINTSVVNGLGQYAVVSFGVQSHKKLSGGYIHNDPANHLFLIHDLKDGELPEKIEVDLATGGRLSVKPALDSYCAYDTVKLGWRKKSGNPEQILKHLKNYFVKMKKVIDENSDNLAHEL